MKKRRKYIGANQKVLTIAMYFIEYIIKGVMEMSHQILYSNPIS